MPVTWSIEKLDVLPELEGKQNVVNRIYWLAELSGSDITVNSRGIETVEYDPAHPFIAYDNLDPTTVINWVFESLGPDNIVWVEESLFANLQDRLNPPPAVESPALPWG